MIKKFPGSLAYFPVGSLTHWFTYSLAHAFIVSHTNWIIHTLAHPLILSPTITYLLIHLLTFFLNQQLICWITASLTLLLTHFKYSLDQSLHSSFMYLLIGLHCISGSLTHCLTHSISHWLPHSLAHPLTGSPTYCLTHMLICSLCVWFTHSFTQSLTHSLTASFYCSLITCLLINLLIHSVSAYSLACPLMPWLNWFTHLVACSHRRSLICYLQARSLTGYTNWWLAISFTGRHWLTSLHYWLNHDPPTYWFI